jgi:hypothetical protein
MKKLKKHIYQHVYNQNPETDSYLIEISLDNYGELFNGWDASPLRKRDIEPELLEYIEQMSSEIPLHESIELCFYMPSSLRDFDKEFRSISSVMNNFKVVIGFIDRKLKRFYRQMMIYLSLAITFLTSAYLLRNTVTDTLFLDIMIEGFFIGGWFLLWEVFSIFTFESHEERLRRKIMSRFLISDIYFKDKKE